MFNNIGLIATFQTMMNRHSLNNSNIIKSNNYNALVVNNRTYLSIDDFIIMLYNAKKNAVKKEIKKEEKFIKLDEKNELSIDLIEKIKKNKHLIRKIKHVEYPDESLPEHDEYNHQNIDWEIKNFLNIYDIKINYKYQIDSDVQDRIVLYIKDKINNIKYELWLNMFIAIFDKDFMQEQDWEMHSRKCRFLNFLLLEENELKEKKKLDKEHKKNESLNILKKNINNE